MGGKRFVPTTFEERGVAAPFTTPVLCQARVRKDYRERLEVVMPNITDGFGNYVVPWNDLPEIASMTVHDRMLYRLIAKISATTPDTMRTVAAVVAKTGLAGATMATRTTIIENDDLDRFRLVHGVLLARLMQSRGRPTAELMRLLGTEDGWDLALEEVAQLEKSLGIAGRGFEEKFHELCRLAIQVGIARSEQPGRLRTLIASLRQMSQTLRRWAEDDRTDAATVAVYIADTADHTLEIAEPLLAEIDRRLGEVSRILTQTDIEVEGLRRQIGRLAWLVDGWDHLVAWWQRALDGDRRDQVVAISGTFRVLPLVPKQEMLAPRKGKETGQTMYEEEPRLPPSVVVSAQRLIREVQNWRAGSLDYGLVQEIEDLRAVAC